MENIFRKGPNLDGCCSRSAELGVVYSTVAGSISIALMGDCSSVQSEQVEQFSDGQDDHECCNSFLQLTKRATSVPIPFDHQLGIVNRKKNEMYTVYISAVASFLVVPM